MKKRLIAAVAMTPLVAGRVLAHPGFQDHPHPHTDAASYFTAETFVIFAVGLSFGGTIAWYRRRKENDK